MLLRDFLKYQVKLVNACWMQLQTYAKPRWHNFLICFSFWVCISHWLLALTVHHIFDQCNFCFVYWASCTCRSINASDFLIHLGWLGAYAYKLRSLDSLILDVPYISTIINFAKIVLIFLFRKALLATIIINRSSCAASNGNYCLYWILTCVQFSL